MKTLTCKCGKKSQEFDKANTVQDMADKSNFAPVASFTCRTNWLCGDCYDKAHKLAIELHSIVKDEDIYFSSLLEPKNELFSATKSKK